MTESRELLSAGHFEAAKRKINSAITTPRATNLSEARRLEEQIKNATDHAYVRNALMMLSDEVFEQFKEDGDLPSQMELGYEVLDARTAAVATSQFADVTESRETRRLAQLKAERLRKIADERQRERDEALAARRAAQKAKEER